MQLHPVPARAVTVTRASTVSTMVTVPVEAVPPLFRTVVAKVSPVAPGGVEIAAGEPDAAKSVAVLTLTVAEPVKPAARVSTTEMVWLPNVLRVNWNVCAPASLERKV